VVLPPTIMGPVRCGFCCCCCCCCCCTGRGGCGTGAGAEATIGAETGGGATCG
jgi:hypothetical protein